MGAALNETAVPIALLFGMAVMAQFQFCGVVSVL
jgi:hypothetical protein